MCAARRCVQVPSSWKMCKAWAHPFELLLPPLAPPLPAAWRHSGTRVRTRLAIPRARPSRPRSAGGSSSSDAAASADTTTTAAARQHSRRLPRRRRRACERRVAASDRMPPPRRGAIAPASLRSTALTAPARLRLHACAPPACLWSSLTQPAGARAVEYPPPVETCAAAGPARKQHKWRVARQRGGLRTRPPFFLSSRFSLSVKRFLGRSRAPRVRARLPSPAVAAAPAAGVCFWRDCRRPCSSSARA